ERYLSSSYGIFKGNPIGRATLRFYGGAARAVREQVWHKDQTAIQVSLPDGSKALDLTLPVHDWTELLGRALRCGSNCEVVAPKDFRAQWKEEIGRMGELAGNEAPMKVLAS
ncbi:MAG: WYL domain-containing protein, partial [Candidatus Shapirobacteria bacterium]